MLASWMIVILLFSTQIASVVTEDLNHLPKRNDRTNTQRYENQQLLKGIKLPFSKRDSSSFEINFDDSTNVPPFQINFPQIVPFRNTSTSSVFVNTNGFLSFNEAADIHLQPFMPYINATNEGPPVAAVFWSNIMPSSGIIWAGLRQNDEDIRQAQTLISIVNPINETFVVSTLVVTTYQTNLPSSILLPPTEQDFVNGTNNDDDVTNENSNLFQMSVVSDGNRTFAIVAYKKLNPKVDADVVAGFFRGNGNMISDDFFFVSDQPSSSTSLKKDNGSNMNNNIISQLLVDSNCGRPGTYVFDVTEIMKIEGICTISHTDLEFLLLISYDAATFPPGSRKLPRKIGKRCERIIDAINDAIEMSTEIDCRLIFEELDKTRNLIKKKCCPYMGPTDDCPMEESQLTDLLHIMDNIERNCCNDKNVENLCF